MEPPDHRISRIARPQHGAVHRDQLLDERLSGAQIRGRLESGRIEPAYRGVYRVGGGPAMWEQRLTELTLAGGLGTVVSHRAAVELWGLLAFDRPLEVVTPRPRRFRVPFEDPIIHTSVVLPDEDMTVRGQVPVTTVERSLLDLGAVVHARKVQYAVDAALRLGLTHPEALADLLARRRKRGRRGVRALDQALESGVGQRSPGSRYERDVVELLRDLGLPTPELQHPVRANGRTVYLDLAWPEAKLGVEIDGHGFHSTRAERASDADRQNQLHVLGWTLLRFTTDQVFERPEVVGQTIWRALARS